MESPNSPEELDSRWQALHRAFAMQLYDSTGVRESLAIQPRAASLDERLIQAIWSDQMLRAPELVTASGKRIVIEEPGRWNTGRGPDFLDARLRIAGAVVTGDVEIHLDSVGWQRHGHHQDFEYNRVVLHVALRAGDDRPFDEKQNGERLERLVIEPFLEPDLDTIRSTINLGDYPYGRPEETGLCHESFLRLPDDQLFDFFRTAGRSRIEQKIARFAAQGASANSLQVIYQSLLTAQGFKSSKTLYFLLGKRCPISELLDYSNDYPASERPDFFLAIFLHTANLMPVQEQIFEDDETISFVAKLRKYWNAARPYFSDRIIPPTKRWFSGMRPAGFPTRRLAAVALLLGRLVDRTAPLLKTVEEWVLSAPADPKLFKKSVADIVVRCIVDEPAHYFSTHFTFGGKKQSPQSLLGEPAAESLLFNVLLPMIILKARKEKNRPLESATWAVLSRFPSLEKNSVVKFMAQRLFGSTGTEKGLLKTELFQQALFKVFADCCAQNERSCDDCTFISLASKVAAERRSEFARTS